jgi:CubicO group peptidase (beta-lactamase class C family)
VRALDPAVPDSPGARALLDDAVGSGIAPAAVIEAGRSGGPIWTYATGRLSPEPDAPAATPRTVFDLASLTKVIVTTSLAMRLVTDGRVRLSDRVATRVGRWRGTDRTMVTIRDLLEHCGGLTAWLPLFRSGEGRATIEPLICELPLEYAPWTASVYSDLGFILLGFVIEDAAGARLDTLAERLLEDDDLRFRPPPSWRARTAPTEFDPWRGRRLVCDVHDENAWALGGVSGHAGLFGTAEAVGRFARLVLETGRRETRVATPEVVRRFLTRSTVPRSSRALGWDTMLPTSSCGLRLSGAAFGHTGFTGTSLWIDPQRDLYVVLLTNRVYATREDTRIRALRPRVHDAVVEELD